ncbi:alpha/beta-Hydrolases superfamily protein [Striga asiatica]|uniref:Alpha/beta-Hydrolases superfamily protein n=1 Tax=Striga asiatica TaxID=4170 RepID=A0A5A7PGR3_STRAF|nr:alpha/beta-Hydrolases superfamily protein [Striga asiatica]
MPDIVGEPDRIDSLRSAFSGRQWSRFTGCRAPHDGVRASLTAASRSRSTTANTHSAPPYLPPSSSSSAIPAAIFALTIPDNGRRYGRWEIVGKSTVSRIQRSQSPSPTPSPYSTPATIPQTLYMLAAAVVVAPEDRHSSTRHHRI